MFENLQFQVDRPKEPDILQSSHVQIGVPVVRFSRSSSMDSLSVDIDSACPSSVEEFDDSSVVSEVESVASVKSDSGVETEFVGLGDNPDESHLNQLTTEERWHINENSAEVRSRLRRRKLRKRAKIRQRKLLDTKFIHPDSIYAKNIKNKDTYNINFEGSYA